MLLSEKKSSDFLLFTPQKRHSYSNSILRQ